MDAGAACAQQGYALRYALDVNDPNASTSVCEGTPDSETAEIIAEELPDTAVFTGFEGTLDHTGMGIAQLTLRAPLPCHWVGQAIHVDFTLDQAPESVLERVSILILE